MRRQKLPRYGSTPAGLTDEAVHRVRTAGMTDAYFARLYHVSTQAVRLARIGETFKEHPTPPDLRERMSPGRHSTLDGKALIVARAVTSSDISRALMQWRLPDNGTPPHE